MSRKSELLTLTKNQGLTEFIFFLENSSLGLTQLIYIPDGWIGSGVVYERSIKYKGVFRSFTNNELSFPKDGRDYIQTVLNTQGVEGNIIFTVKKLNSTTYDYDDYFQGKVDLSTCEINELFANVEIIDNSFTEKTRSRDEINVDLNSTKSIGGTTFQAIAGYYSIHEFTTQWTSTLAVSNYLVPLPEKIFQFNESQVPALTGVINLNVNTFMKYITLPYQLIFNIQGTGKVFSGVSHSTLGATISIRVRTSYPAVTTDHVIWGNSAPNTDEFDIDIDEDLTLDLEQFDRLYLIYQTIGDDPDTVQIQLDTLTFTYNQGYPLELTLPEYGLNAVANWHYVLDPLILHYNYTHIVPTTLVGSDFSEARTPSDVPDNKDGALFFEATEDYSVNLSISVDITLNIQSYPFNVAFYYIILYSTGAQKSKTLLSENLSVWNENVSFDLDTGESLLIQCDKSGYVEITYNSIIVEFSSTTENLPAITIGAYPTYEGLLKLSQMITDESNPFYSEFFGRTDSAYEPYGSDGEISHFTNGMAIRGGSIINNTINLSLSKAFQSLNSIHNLGLGIEIIDGIYKIRIEDWEYFFDENIILDVSDRIDESLIKKEVLPEWHYNQIFVGYKDFLYEESGGLYEFNTKVEYSTVISTIKNTLNIVSEYRGDTQGIILLRRKPILSYPTEDVKGESDIFMIASLRDGDGFKARTDENFENVVGGAGANRSYDLDYTPAQNIRNHGSIIRAGLEFHKNTLLRWLGSNKNTTLITNKYAEPTVWENRDIQINDLNTPRWHPEAYVCEVPIYAADLTAIEANPRGLIKLSDTKYGWILSVKTDGENRTGELKLLRVNLTYVTPV